MRLTLHHNDRERLNVEVALSADEAEEWIARLQTAVRNAREGRGDQLLLLGEPARIVLTVQEWDPEPEAMLPPPYEDEAILERDRVLAVHQSRLILLALIVLMFLLLYRFRILPI